MNCFRSAAQERVRDAAYDAADKVLNSIVEPLNRRAVTARWNEASEATAKYLEELGIRNTTRDARLDAEKLLSVDP